MASNMIGNLAVSLTMNTAAFQKGATLAEKRAETLNKRMAGIGSSIAKLGGALALGAVAAGVAVLGNMATKAFELGSSLTEAAAKVGVTVEALQEMRFAATQNGISIETMDGSLNKMTRTLGELSLGNKTVAGNFKELGLSAQSFVGLSADQSFIKIAEALGKVESETERAAIGNKIFGRSYAELKPLVDQGAAGIAAAIEQKRKDGVISTEQAAKLDDLADGWDRLKEQLVTSAAQFIANRAASGKASDGLAEFGRSIDTVIRGFEKLLSYKDRINTFFNNIAIKLSERARDSALTRNIPGVAESAQANINRLQADNQRNSSNPGKPRSLRRSGGAGGVLGGTMAGAGAGALDTLDRLEKKAAGISSRVAKPVKAALTEVQKAFKELSDNANPLLDRLFPEVKALLDYKADSNTLSAWAKAGKIDADKLTESLIRLRDSYYGVDGPVSVNEEDGGLAQEILDALPPLEDVLGRVTGKIKATNVVIKESFADMASEVVGSLSGLASSIKGGGFIGILDGLLNVAIALGKIGAFGKTISTRLNSPPPGRARGGAMTSNRSYLVGERGPEIMTMGGRPGYMTPNNKMGGDGRSMSISVNPSPYFDVTVDQRASAVAAPLAARGAIAGASLAESKLATRQRNRIP